MNSLDSILEKIKAETDAKCEEILAEAKEKCNQIAKESAEKADRKAKEIAASYEKEALSATRRVQSSSALEQRAEVLSAKQGCIDKAFENVYQKLCHLSDTELVEKMASLAVPYIKDGRECLVINPKYERLCVPLSEKVQSLCRFGGKCAVSERVTDVGVVVKTGDVEENLTFGALLRSQREGLEETVVRILF